MKRHQTSLSSILAGSVVANSLFVSGLIGTVTALADDRGDSSAFRGGRTATKSQRVVEQIGFKASSVEERTSVIPVSDSTSSGFGAYIAKDGSISGRFSVTDAVSGADVPAESFSVRFVQRGSTIAETMVGSGGTFRVTGLGPGAYSLIGSGADGFFMCGLIVHPYMTGLESSNNLQIDATVVHPSNVGIVRQLIGQVADIGGGNAIPAKGQASYTKASLVGASTADASDVIADTSDVASGAIPVQTPVLSVDSSGHVDVRIDDIDAATGASTPSAGGTVYLIQRGGVKGRYQINQDGSFETNGIPSGSYSLLALSPAGGQRIAAIGVIVESAPTAGTVKNDSRLSVLPARLSNRKAAKPTIQTAPGSDLPPGPGSPQPPQNPPQLAGGGGFGGGSGGGFGGGSGGGGFGGLGALAGLAGLAGLAALNNDDDNPASPFQP